MTDLVLAQYSNLALYSAMAVFTLAMLGYALYLAGLVPTRHAAREEARERELVAAGAAPGDTVVSMGGADAPAPVVGAGVGDATYEAPLKARKAANIARMLTWLGTVLLVASVALRGLSVHRAPLGNMFEFSTMACMFTVLAFSIWSVRRDLRWLGLFVVAPVLLVLGMAVVVWYTEAAELMPSLQSYWLVIHVTVATLAVALMTIGAAASGAMERVSYGIHVIGFPLWTFTLIAGAIWAREAWGSYWNWDPKEVWTFVIWVVYAAYLHARATSGVSRQNANWIAIAGMACIIINYAVVNVFFVGQHSYSGL